MTNRTWRTALAWLVAAVIGVGFMPMAHAFPPPPPAPKPKAAAKQAPKTVKPKRPANAAKTPAGRKTATPDPIAGGAGPAATNSDVRQSDLYGDRLDGLQVDVDQLKDKIFRSKARLSLLKETVLRGVLAGSRVVLAHRNLMGAGFKLVRIVYSMDGAQIYARTDESGSLDSEDELTIYDGNLPPGPHNVSIELTYTGHGYGVFSYLNGYTFTSTSSHSFTAPENGAVKVSSAGFESGNLTTEMKDRPNTQWSELLLDASGRPLPKQGRRGKPAARKSASKKTAK